MTEAWRLPFLTEGVIQYPGGVSDPVHQKHRTLQDAEDHADREARDSGGVFTVYRIAEDGDTEEIGVFSG